MSHEKSKVSKGIDVAVTSYPNPNVEHKDQYWDDLLPIYESIREALLGLVHIINDFLSNEMIRLALSKDKNIVELTKNFDRDANIIAEDVGNIFAKHGNKTGIVDEEDIYDMLDIFGEYMEIKNKMDDILLPSYTSIAEAIGNINKVQEDVL